MRLTLNHAAYSFANRYLGREPLLPTRSDDELVRIRDLLFMGTSVRADGTRSRWPALPSPPSFYADSTWRFSNGSRVTWSGELGTYHGANNSLLLMG